jgi:uncharacterized protein with FMN-binding domain
MKRNVVWLLSTLSAVVLLFGYHTSTSGALTSSAGTPAVSSARPDRTSTTSGQGGGNGGGSSGSSGSSGTSTVTGDTVQTAWGPVQVELTLQGGTITDVSVLQYPDGNPQDQQINAYALPVLVQETLDGQSAQIDMVSGATITSDGYVQSLQSALDRAGL